MRKRQIKDAVFNGFTAIGVISVLLLLVVIFGFVFKEGYGLLSKDLFTIPYHPQHYVGRIATDEQQMFEQPSSLPEEAYFIASLGVAIAERQDLAGNPVIEFVYVAKDSPLRSLILRNEQTVAIREGMHISRVAFEDVNTVQRRQGALIMAQTIDDHALTIREMSVSIPGGGIQAALKSTLLLIGLTLIIVLPIGILSALYLTEFAPNSTLTRLIRRFIETLTGVPSIVFGLIGLSVLIPFTVRTTPATGGNMIAGALTLSMILLPVVIRTTEEGFMSVPVVYKEASLALGANRTQTAFLIVFPQALPSILTTVFLSIGRIIGESAALIFVLGTAVNDQVGVFDRSPTFAVQIWSLMTREPPNVQLASTIAIILLVVVLMLNIIIKLLVSGWQRRRV